MLQVILKIHHSARRHAESNSQVPDPNWLTLASHLARLPVCTSAGLPDGFGTSPLGRRYRCVATDVSYVEAEQTVTLDVVGDDPTPVGSASSIWV
jgi:hypothetical protein